MAAQVFLCKSAVALLPFECFLMCFRFIFSFFFPMTARLQTQKPRRFDDELPDISVEDLQYLKSCCPAEVQPFLMYVFIFAH